MAKATRTAQLLSVLQRGRAMTVEQIRDQFEFASNQSVTATISTLRQAGYQIEHYPPRGDERFGRYRIGPDPRAARRRKAA